MSTFPEGWSSAEENHLDYYDPYKELECPECCSNNVEELNDSHYFDNYVCQDCGVNWSDL